ncbi:hypothetical protein VTN77DRAFT_1078 [Rasamsonia byssochlamydoides]|uniref:uncharacterized protein n=1 Tax=Rasamsonia byssochlamydoides TaxID=89139 RepID=UPI0037434464
MEREIVELRDALAEEQRINEIRDKGIKREFRTVHELIDGVKTTMNARFDAVDKKFKLVDDRFNSVDDRFNSVDMRLNQMDMKLNEMAVRIANSNILSLQQLIQPLLVYGESGMPLPIPEGFPMTAHQFWKLHKRKLPKLEGYLAYYKLERKVIRAVHRLKMLYDSDSDTDAETVEEQRSVTEFRDAIKSDPLSALKVLATHLGVDFNTLQNREDEMKIIKEHSRAMKQPRPTLEVGVEKVAGNVSQSKNEGNAHNGEGINIGYITVTDTRKDEAGNPIKWTIPTRNGIPLLTVSIREPDPNLFDEVVERSQILKWEADSEKFRLENEKLFGPARPQGAEEAEGEEEEPMRQQEEEGAQEEQRAGDDLHSRASVTSEGTTKTEAIPTQILLAQDEERRRRDEEMEALLRSRRSSIVSR